MPMPIGVYPFSRAGSYTGDQFNTWLGRPAARRTAYLPYWDPSRPTEGRWPAILASVAIMAKWMPWSGGSPVSINIGMGGPLEELAANKLDATGKRPTDWLTLIAKAISAATPVTQTKIDAFYPWEFDGFWCAWSSLGREDDFKTCCRRIHDTFKAVDPRFVFWLCMAGRQGVTDDGGHRRAVNPLNSNPGWAYLDGLAADVYRYPRSRPVGVQGPVDNADDATVWAHRLNDPYGIAWMVSKADGAGKGKRINELGVAIDAPVFMDSALTYAAAHNIEVNLFNTSDGRDDFTVSTGLYPQTAAVIKAHCA